MTRKNRTFVSAGRVSGRPVRPVAWVMRSAVTVMIPSKRLSRGVAQARGAQGEGAGFGFVRPGPVVPGGNDVFVSRRSGDCLELRPGMYRPPGPRGHFGPRHRSVVGSRRRMQNPRVRLEPMRYEAPCTGSERPDSLDDPPGRRRVPNRPKP